MKLLIDTNILIHLEDNKIIDKHFSKFYNLAVSNSCKILYHPKAIPEDINRDKNSERKKIILSKMEKYQKLENYAILTEEFGDQLKNSKINDQIDNMQLFQLFKEYVDYLITEDKGIHSKAKVFGLGLKVLDIKQAYSLLNSKFSVEIPRHPILEEQSIRSIERHFNSEFFNSLRADYNPEIFDKWLDKCVRMDRRCYTLFSDNELKALLIYNIEKVEEHQIPHIFKNVLKICTFKVADNAFGIKLGELFLNKMFEYFINQDIEYLYLTVYEKQEHLIRLLTDFGFASEYFENSIGQREIRMIKTLDKSQVSSGTNNLVDHPFYSDGDSINKYVIPIQPQYYHTLFKDGNLRTDTLFDSTIESINEIHGNTIVKAYISKSNNLRMKKGDLLFFYSSKTAMQIEPVGVLESVQIVNDKNNLISLVRNKTVFSNEKLADMLDRNGKLHVIIFRLITFLKKTINRKKIEQIGSFKNNLQTITQLKEEDYIELKNEGYFDERYIIN